MWWRGVLWRCGRCEATSLNNNVRERNALVVWKVWGYQPLEKHAYIWRASIFNTTNLTGSIVRYSQKKNENLPLSSTQKLNNRWDCADKNVLPSYIPRLIGNKFISYPPAVRHYMDFTFIRRFLNIHMNNNLLTIRTLKLLRFWWWSGTEFFFWIDDCSLVAKQFKFIWINFSVRHVNWRLQRNASHQLR